MFSKLKAWIVGEVRTVEGIIANFTNTVRQLEVHAVSKMTEAARHKATAAEATVKAEEARLEASKAFQVADQIKELVDPASAPVIAPAPATEVTR